MKNWITKNEYKISQVLSGRSNAYLIKKDKDTILVDTGKSASYARLSKNIEALNESIDSFSFLILTHTHFDHCQSSKKIKERSNCQIIVSQIAASWIANGYSQLPNGTFPTTKLIAKLGRLIGKRKFSYQPFIPDTFVNGAYELEINETKLKIIETAGHSADSVSILVDNEIAIVGDAMFGVFSNSVFPPYSDDIHKMIESWGKLLNTNCQIFLPGHGKEITRNLLEKEYIKYSKKYNCKPPLG